MSLNHHNIGDLASVRDFERLGKTHPRLLLVLMMSREGAFHTAPSRKKKK